MINYIIAEYPNTNDFIQQKLIGNRWGNLFLLSKSRSKNIFTNQARCISKSVYAINKFKNVICFMKRRLSLYIVKEGLVYVY